MKLNKRWKMAAAITLAVASIFLILHLLFPLPKLPPNSTLVYDNQGKLMHAFLASDQKWRMKIELAEIDERLQKIITQKEDQWFYYHFGVNPIAIIRAAVNNIRSKKRTSGASTITMQVARLLEPRPRTIGSKLIEVFRAFQLEIKYSKAEILQLYLNLAPYGGNIEGVKSASILLYGCLPKDLSLGQIISLSIIPNRPNSLGAGRNPELLMEEKNRWVQLLAKKANLSDQDIADAIAEPVPNKRLIAPKYSPHLANRLKSLGNKTYHTNINFETQQQCVTVLKRQIEMLRTKGIGNAAAIVIENETGKIVAYVGSADFDEDFYQGQVDGIKAIRSPGSTLKPLIFAQAIDKGLVTPKTILLDVPKDFDGFRPVNFDQKFNGTVSAEDALAFSLNLPAVQLLSAVGVGNFIDLLGKHGFKQIQKDRKKLGLSAILGGCGVSLEELTGIFAGLANGGVYHKPTLLATQKQNPNKRFCSEEAASMVTDILKRVQRPDFPLTHDYSIYAPRIAWKTGTSYGRRDAWSIGYNHKYTIGVWAGNFDNTGNPLLSGAEIATPILFKLFDAIDPGSQGPKSFPAPNIRERSVCAKTGMPPADFCTDLINDYFLPGISNYQICSHLKKVEVDAFEQISYCKSCLPASGYKVKHYDNPPPELLSFMQASNSALLLPPPHNDACTQKQLSGVLSFKTPINGKEYWIDETEDGEMAFEIEAPADASTIFWFLDEKYLGKSSPSKPYFHTFKTSGNYQLKAADDLGRTQSVSFNVRVY